MNEMPYRTKKYEPPPVREVAADAKENPKKPVFSHFGINVHPDGTYTEELTGQIDLVTIVCALNELQTICAKLHAALMQQADEQRRNALAGVNLLGRGN